MTEIPSAYEEIIHLLMSRRCSNLHRADIIKDEKPFYEKHGQSCKLVSTDWDLQSTVSVHWHSVTVRLYLTFVQVIVRTWMKNIKRVHDRVWGELICLNLLKMVVFYDYCKYCYWLLFAASNNMPFKMYILQWRTQASNTCSSTKTFFFRSYCIVFCSS